MDAFYLPADNVEVLGGVQRDVDARHAPDLPAVAVFLGLMIGLSLVGAGAGAAAWGMAGRVLRRTGSAA